MFCRPFFKLTTLSCPTNLVSNCKRDLLRRISVNLYTWGNAPGRCLSLHPSMCIDPCITIRGLGSWARELSLQLSIALLVVIRRNWKKKELVSAHALNPVQLVEIIWRPSPKPALCHKRWHHFAFWSPQSHCQLPHPYPYHPHPYPLPFSTPPWYFFIIGFVIFSTTFYVS